MFIYTIGDIIGVALCLLFAAVWAIVEARRAWRQWRCKHERVFENGRCHAICQNCHKDLGFIGTWRERNGRK